MAEIKTADEQAALDSNLDSQAQAGYWIGLTDMAEKGKWVWQHSNQKLGPWSNWGNGEPNKYCDIERCTEIWKTSGKWEWNDVSCAGMENNGSCVYNNPHLIMPLCQIRAG